MDIHKHYNCSNYLQCPHTIMALVSRQKYYLNEYYTDIIDLICYNFVNYIIIEYNILYTKHKKILLI